MEEALYELLRLCTVRVDLASGHGTGFFVAPGLVLTCAHVVHEAQNNIPLQVYWNGQSIPAIISYTTALDYPDLALLAVDFKGHPCVYLHEGANRLDDFFCSYGYPDDYPSGDTVTCRHEGRTDDQQSLLKLKDGRIRPGMSGAPLLNLRTGWVSGIIKRTHDKDSALGGRAVPTRTIFHEFPEAVDLMQQFHKWDRQWIEARNNPRSETPRQNNSETSSSFIWSVPHLPNDFFTGRESILEQLHHTLNSDTRAALTQAISGLGGIGKTQIAVEYANRYRNEYQVVFWVNADLRNTLALDFANIAKLLNLPEQSEKDTNVIVAAVRRWLGSHTAWLLILDNVEDLEMVREILPSGSKGHILLTTRAQALGTLAQKIDVDKMTLAEGVLFLLRRSKVIQLSVTTSEVTTIDDEAAREIVQEMDGLPLAIDQAGAYIERTQCSLSHYLDLYRTRRSELLSQRGTPIFDHPDSVATTFSLLFEKVKQISSASVELLQLCAFLHPDAIPEEIITDKSPDLTRTLQAIAKDPLKLDEAIAALLKYSLIRRNSDAKTLSIHRLVQAVLKDDMRRGLRQQWAERIVRVVSYGFPTVEFVSWPRCQRYLPHAQVCLNLIQEWEMAFEEASLLLIRMGNFLVARGQYSDVEGILNKALVLRERVFGPDHPLVAQVLGNLASLYNIHGRYAEAEELIKRASDINVKVTGADSPLATNLHEQAELNRVQGRYPQAEQLFRQAAEIFKRNPGNNTYRVYSLNGLADTCRAQGKYPEAELIYLEALAICETAQKPDLPLKCVCLNNLARLYVDQGQYAKAEPLYHQALDNWKQTVGENHPHVGNCLTNLGELYHLQGNIPQAEQLTQQALKIFQKNFGLNHPNIATCLSNLAVLNRNRGDYTQAEKYGLEALRIREKALGTNHPDVAISLHNVAFLYNLQGRYKEAEPMLKRALSIYEQAVGPDHLMVAAILEGLANTLYHTNQRAKAEELISKARRIRSNQTTI